MWLLDQKPTTLTAAAKFADQYVAVRKASHTDKAHDWKPKSRQGNTGVKPPVPVSRPSVHSSSSTADAKPADSSTKPTSRDPFRSKVICFYCKRPGHTISDCRRRMAKAVTESSGAPVQLVSTQCSNLLTSQTTAILFVPGFWYFVGKTNCRHKKPSIIKSWGPLCYVQSCCSWHTTYRLQDTLE